MWLCKYDLSKECEGKYRDCVDCVLDKIRAEIENDWQLKKYPSSPFACGLRRAMEIIDQVQGRK